MKNINVLTKFKQIMRGVVTTAIISTALVFVGSTNTVQAFGKVIKQPTVVYKNQTGIAMGEGISIRRGPGAQYGWQGGFHRGTTIKILGTSGSWYKVSYSGITGYASKQYIKIVVKPTVIATTKNISKLIKYGFTYKSLYGKGTSPDYVFYNYIYKGRPTWHQVNDLTVGLDGNSVCIAIQYWNFSNSKVPSLTQKALNVFLPNGGNQIYSRINQIYNRSNFSQINETHQISGHKIKISTGAGGNLFVTIYN